MFLKKRRTCLAGASGSLLSVEESGDHTGDHWGTRGHDITEGFGEDPAPSLIGNRCGYLLRLICEQGHYVFTRWELARSTELSIGMLRLLIVEDGLFE